MYNLKGDCRPHVMISYQWDSQSTMLKVKESLKEAGFKVWMDVENISQWSHFTAGYENDLIYFSLWVKNFKLRDNNVFLVFLGGSTLEAMSLAIENAAVVLIGMSKKYKESPNCRSGNGRVLRCFLRYQSRLINFQDSQLCKKKKNSVSTLWLANYFY